MHDLLGDILSGVRLASTVFCRAEMTMPWGFDKERLDGAPFHAIISGEAWIALDGDTSPRRLGPGDMVVLPQGDPHRLLGSATAPSVCFKDLLAQQGRLGWKPGMKVATPERLVYGGGGAATVFISGVFAFADRRRNPLLAALPSLIHLPGEGGSSAAWLAPTLLQLEDEAIQAKPGAGAVVARLADILFIQAIRSHLADRPGETPGWLRGMTDPAIGTALAAIHAEPGADWSLASLARCAGLSRTVFAARFATLVGKSPIAYLTEWRLHEAAGHLAEDHLPVGKAAALAGYRSELAFAKAFRRHFGLSPSAYRRMA